MVQLRVLYRIMRNIVKQFQSEVENRYKECSTVKETEQTYVRLLIDIKEALGRIAESDLFSIYEQREIQRQAYQYLAEHHSKVEQYIKTKSREQFIVFPKQS